MHFDILTRGPKMWVDNMITQLQGIYLPWEVKKDGTCGYKARKYMAQMRVCPVQLWDLSFPKEYQDTILNTLLVDGGKAINPKHQKFIWGLQKALGLKKVPEYDPKSQVFPMKAAVRKHIEVIGIGVKEDRIEDGTEML